MMDIYLYEEILRKRNKLKNKKPVAKKSGVVEKEKRIFKQYVDNLIDIYKHYGEGEKEKQEPIICKHFGCGKELLPQEQVFGDRCQQHQKKETTLSIIDKHLSQ